MKEEKELEWAEAQKSTISEDLVAASKQQLLFLAEVDRHRQLYNGHALDRAIYRYKYCWLPLLAKKEKFQALDCALVVPLDCEWVWHCHRLNLVRYKSDCMELYGRILGSKNVVSSTQATCKTQTEEIWNGMYPYEPYELNLSTQMLDLGSTKSTTYDLVSAVERQSSFYYQVSKSYMKDDAFLEDAVARYKGFLHLIRRNQEKSIRLSCVPTYDIDLIWHSHRLHPISYRKDLMALLGRVLDHDDTDTDRTKGGKMDTGFSRTAQLWEETFGSRYWRAGAMYKGYPPSPPLTINLSELSNLTEKEAVDYDFSKYQNMIQFPKKMFVEVVMVEIIEVRNVPATDNESLSLIFSKKQPDLLFYGNRRLSISSEAGEKEKEVAVFQCEPNGELICELVSYSSSLLHLAKLGTTSISLQDIMKPGSPLAIEKWLEFLPNSGFMCSSPINIRLALSFTPPVQAPFILQLVKTNGNGLTRILDEIGNEILRLQMRDSMKVEAKDSYCSKKEVIGKNIAGETHVLAELAGTGWSLMNSSWCFLLEKKFNEAGHTFELTGQRKVIIFPGRQMEYGMTVCEKHRNDQNWMTAIEYSAEYPFGKAVAVFDLKSGFIKINEEWVVIPGILLAFLLSDPSTKKGICGVISSKENIIEEICSALEDSKCNRESGNKTETMNCENCLIEATTWGGFGMEDIVKSGGCGGGQCGGPSCKCSSSCGGCHGGCGSSCSGAVPMLEAFQKGVRSGSQ